MCQKIRELQGKTPDELLDRTNQLGVFPVDVAQICFQMGIRLQPFDFTPIETNRTMRANVSEKGAILGAIVAHENDLAILYRPDTTILQRRYTIAHEIAHSCLHMEPDSQVHIEFMTDRDNPTEKERAANAFARKLLIPADALRKLTGNSPVVESWRLPGLAERFLVTENVMRQRLGDMELRLVKNRPDSVGAWRV